MLGAVAIGCRVQASAGIVRDAVDDLMPAPAALIGIDVEHIPTDVGVAVARSQPHRPTERSLEGDPVETPRPGQRLLRRRLEVAAVVGVGWPCAVDALIRHGARPPSVLRSRRRFR